MSKKQHDIGMDEDWKAEDDFRTLQRAAEIANDKARFDKAMKHAEKRSDEISKLVSNRNGLRKALST